MTVNLRALTLNRPWVYAVTALGKPRTWRPAPALVGQRLATHARDMRTDVAPRVLALEPRP